MNNWKETTLGEYISIKHGFAFKGEHFTEEENHNVLLTPGNFHIGGGFKDDKYKYYTGEFPSDYVLKEDDLVVTMTDLSKDGDTLGFPAKIPYSENKRFLHNQRIGLVEFLNDDLFKDYLYYLMCTKEYQRTIVNGASGSTVRHTSPTKIQEYEFTMPSLSEQKAIAAILSSFDDKIELLRRQNKTLESIAQSIFKKWFVKFRIKNSELKIDKKTGLPDGWRMGKLGELAEIKNGFAFKSEDYIEEAQYPIIRTMNFEDSGYISNNNRVYISREKAKEYKAFNFDEFDLCVVMVGASLGKTALITRSNLPSLQNQNMWSFKPKNNKCRFYVNFQVQSLIKQNIKSASGSARDFFRKDHFYNIDVLVPLESVMLDFDKLARSLFERISNNLSQFQTLSKLRDALLPKLMKGEIRVKDNLKNI